MSTTTYPEYSENSPNVTILDPKIIVFHNVVSDCKGYIDFYETNMPWDGWFRFGSQISVEAIMHGPLIKNIPEFPTIEEWHNSMVEDVYIFDRLDDPYKQELSKSMYSASKFYVEYTNHTQPSWVMRPWALAKYTPEMDVIVDDHLAMHYHTDYVLRDADSPGEKFAITAVFYPNDEYDGGEISFRLLGEEGVLKQIDYKPKAGDIVMFPSGHPYYHGVRRVLRIPKYITRMYWLYTYEGSDEWHELNAKYGSEKFAELEKERIKNNELMVAKPYPRPLFTIKEYYDLLDAGQLAQRLSEKRKEAGIDR
jgi:signal peptidase I